MTRTAVTVAPLLVFDGDCAFCTTSVHWLEDRFPGSFQARPYQRLDPADYGLTATECHDAVRWVGRPEQPVGTGQRGESGARAVGALLRAGGAARGGATGAIWSALGLLAFVVPTSWAAAGVYRAVAANRYRLPGGTPACRL